MKLFATLVIIVVILTTIIGWGMSSPENAKIIMGDTRPETQANEYYAEMLMDLGVKKIITNVVWVRPNTTEKQIAKIKIIYKLVDDMDVSIAY